MTARCRSRAVTFIENAIPAGDRGAADIAPDDGYFQWRDGFGQLLAVPSGAPPREPYAGERTAFRLVTRPIRHPRHGRTGTFTTVLDDKTPRLMNYRWQLHPRPSPYIV